MMRNDVLRNVLVVDDEDSMRDMLRVTLEREGYAVFEAENGSAALEIASKKSFGFIICDLRMPSMDGIECIKRLREIGCKAIIIAMSAYGDTETALESIRAGADDYINKPFETAEFLFCLQKASERAILIEENKRLKTRLDTTNEIYDMVATSKEMESILEMIKKVCDYDTTIMLYGESGTGKEIVARMIHNLSKRKDQPFVAINCGAIPATLLESELFGYIKGAFTDAYKNKKGLFEAAEGGTVFLDEIGEMPLELQVKLLRVLQERKVRRIGDIEDRPIHCRIIAATVRDLFEEVKAKRFREDLFYRLNVIPIKIPPLRERVGDIEPLVEHFITKIARRRDIPPKKVSPEAMDLLKAYTWPGNVRELENFVERLLVLCDGDVIEKKDVERFLDLRGLTSPSVQTERFNLKKQIEKVEKDLISRVLIISSWNKKRAAELLGITTKTLNEKIKQYNICDNLKDSPE